MTLAALLAGLMQGAVGFGFAVLFVPLATIVVGAKAAVASSLLLSVAAATVPLLAERSRPPMRPVAPLVAAALLGTPLGIVVLARTDESVLRFLVGLAVLAAVFVPRRAGPSGRPVPRDVLPLLGVGLVSGVSRGATSMGGPPLVLYLHWASVAQEGIRTMLLSYLAVMSVIGVPFVLLSGEVTAQVLQIAAAGTPAVTVGALLGRRLRPLIADAQYRRLSMGLLIVAGAGAVAAALGGLR